MTAGSVGSVTWQERAQRAQPWEIHSLPLGLYSSAVQQGRVSSSFSLTSPFHFVSIYPSLQADEVQAGDSVFPSCWCIWHLRDTRR